MKTIPRLASLLCLLVAALFAASPASAAAPAPDSNAVWLTRANVTTPNLVLRVPEMADRLQELGVRYLFLNSASLSPQGTTVAKAEHLVPYLDALADWERANDYRFTVLIWMTGTVDPAEARFLDITNAGLRDTVAAEAARYLDPHAPGSFVAGCRRRTDGILLDIQPIGGNAGLLKSYTQLLQQVRKIAAPGGQKLGVAAHKLGTQFAWQLSQENYNHLAQHVDYLVGMNYNSGVSTAAEYQAWVEEQTRDTLRAVSGMAWKNKPEFAAPKNGVKVFIGFPAFPFDTRNHREGVELVAPAAAGARSALASLDALSRSYFEGAAVYGHSDGESRDGYARWATDWEAYRATWLAP